MHTFLSIIRSINHTISTKPSSLILHMLNLQVYSLIGSI